MALFELLGPLVTDAYLIDLRECTKVLVINSSPFLVLFYKNTTLSYLSSLDPESEVRLAKANDLAPLDAIATSLLPADSEPILYLEAAKHIADNIALDAEAVATYPTSVYIFKCEDPIYT